MAVLLYRLLKAKGLMVTFAVAVIALLQPSPLPHWGLSASYYWQWGEGQAKVFSTFLLLLAFFLGYINRPKLSGVVFALGFFDPRFALLSLPLFVMYNKKNLRTSVQWLLGALLMSNIMLLYPGTGSGFVSMVLNSGITTPLYYYAFIPLLTIFALMVTNYKELIAAFTGSSRAEEQKELSDPSLAEEVLLRSL